MTISVLIDEYPNDPPVSLYGRPIGIPAPGQHIRSQELIVDDISAAQCEPFSGTTRSVRLRAYGGYAAFAIGSDPSASGSLRRLPPNVDQWETATAGHRLSAIMIAPEGSAPTAPAHTLMGRAAAPGVPIPLDADTVRAELGILSGAVSDLDDLVDGELRFAMTLAQRDKLDGLPAVSDALRKSLANAPGEALLLNAEGKVASSFLPTDGVTEYQGTWNASTNTPELVGGGGSFNAGDYFFVSVAGSTTLDGISAWSVGDKVILNPGTPKVWGQVPGSTPGSLNVLSYQADPTGASSSTAAFTAALAAAAGRELIIPAAGAGYVISNVPIPAAGGCDIVPVGNPIIRFTKGEPAFKYDATPLLSTPITLSTGSITEVSNWPAGSYQRCTKILEAAGTFTGYAAGDIVQIYSDQLTEHNYIPPDYRAELASVAYCHTDGSYIILECVLEHVFAPNTNIVRIRRWTAQPTVRIRPGFVFTADGDPHTGVESDGWSRQPAVKIIGAIEADVDIAGVSTWGTLLWVQCCWGGRYHSHFRKLPDRTNVNGYGLAIYGSSNRVTASVHGTGCRHAADAVSMTPGSFSDANCLHMGTPIRIGFTNSRASAYSYVFNTHMAIGTIFSDCHAVGLRFNDGHSPPHYAMGGFQNRGRNTTFQNCTATNCTVGFYDHIITTPAGWATLSTSLYMNCHYDAGNSYLASRSAMFVAANTDTNANRQNILIGCSVRGAPLYRDAWAQAPNTSLINCTVMEPPTNPIIIQSASTLLVDGLRVFLKGGSAALTAVIRITADSVPVSMTIVNSIVHPQGVTQPGAWIINEHTTNVPSVRQYNLLCTGTGAMLWRHGGGYNVIASTVYLTTP